MFLLLPIILLFTESCNSLILSPTQQTGIGLPCSNRKWASYGSKISTDRRKMVSDAKVSPLPFFNDTIYLAGVYNRVESDNMLIKLHEILASIVLIECVDYKGEFIQLTEDYLNNIVNAKSWASAAHDTNFDYFYGRIYWVELYSIAIANVLAQTLYMLGDKISESTKLNVLNAIETRVIKPMDLHFAGNKEVLSRHWWKDRESNWNLVCWSGVAMIAVSLISDQTKRDKYVSAAFTGSLPYSWSIWNPDGYMLEGGYYNFAVENMIVMRQHMMEASNGKNDYFLTNPNADKMLAFGFEFPMVDTKTAQFGDDSVGEIKNDIRKYIEATYSPNPNPNIEVILNWRVPGQAIRFSLLMEPLNRFPAENRRTFSTGLRKFYEDSVILICRPLTSTGIYATFKLLGGSMDYEGSHNHDDAGSYNIMLNGINVIGDIGCGNYEVTWKNRFEESEIWNSYSHPLPIIGGKLQTRNMNYYFYKNVTQPKVLSTFFSDDSDIIVFDLKSVYPVASLMSLIRTNFYERTPGYESVVVQDKVKFSSLTSYEFGIPSRDGKWVETSMTSNTLTGTFTVNAISINVRIHSINSFTYTAVTKKVNGVTYTRLGISMINPILEDTITVTYF